MNIFLEALNKPADAFKRGNRKVSWILVALTIGVVTIFDPLLQTFVNGTGVAKPIDVLQIVWLSAAGIGTYLLICTLFWIIGKIFGSHTNLKTYIRTWGISYFPTLLCAIIVAVTENYFFLFWNSVFWAMFFNVVFVGILIWKTTLYILFFKEVAQLNRGKLIGSIILGILAIIILAWINAFIGLKTPIL